MDMAACGRKRDDELVAGNCGLDRRFTRSDGLRAARAALQEPALVLGWSSSSDVVVVPAEATNVAAE